ncbi:hypothetical protein BGX24_006145, partial [Mortierella sp. AD032]
QIILKEHLIFAQEFKLIQNAAADTSNKTTVTTNIPPSDQAPNPPSSSIDTRLDYYENYSDFDYEHEESDEYDDTDLLDSENDRCYRR